MIKAIVFDLGGVFVNDCDPMIVEDILSSFGVGPIEIKDALDSFWSKTMAGDDIERYWQDFSVETGLTLPDDYKELVGREYDNNVVVDKDMIGLVSKLKKNGYLVPALTNTNKVHVKTNEKLGLYDSFDLVIKSNDVGLVKPDKRIFLLLLEKIGLKAEDCVFIDDRKHNVEAAINLGFHGIHFSDFEDLVVNFNLIGVNI